MGKKNKEVVEKGYKRVIKRWMRRRSMKRNRKKKRNRCSRIMCKGVKEGGSGEREGEQNEEEKECWYHTIIMKWKIM